MALFIRNAEVNALAEALAPSHRSFNMKADTDEMSGEN